MVLAGSLSCRNTKEMVSARTSCGEMAWQAGKYLSARLVSKCEETIGNPELHIHAREQDHVCQMKQRKQGIGHDDDHAVGYLGAVAVVSVPGLISSASKQVTGPRTTISNIGHPETSQCKISYKPKRVAKLPMHPNVVL